MSPPKFNKIMLVPISHILIFTLFFNLSQALSSCNPQDKKVLLRIKTHFANPPSLVSWNSKTNCCDKWQGVKCASNGRVDELEIRNDTHARGSIPPFLNELPELTRLTLIDLPSVLGPIPPSIVKLTKLEFLWISNTNVAGPIPTFLGQCKQLLGLVLAGNKHTGPIPGFIAGLKNLGILYLNSNGLTGPIPDFLAQLENLSFLDLSDNKLSGRIPEAISKLSNLNNLKLGSNKLSGPIPPYLGLLPLLSTLSLSNNQLSGPIPESLGSGKLMFLELDHNKLTGDASFLFSQSNFGAFQIHINDNALEFDFSNVQKPFVLSDFDISHNLIYGSLPDWIGEPTEMEFSFNVSYNQLCGPIPNGDRFKDASVFANNKCLCGGPLPPCISATSWGQSLSE